MTNPQEAPADRPMPDSSVPNTTVPDNTVPSASTVTSESSKPFDTPPTTDSPTRPSTTSSTVGSSAPPPKRTFSRGVLAIVAAIALAVGLLAGGGAGFAIGAWATSFAQGDGMRPGPDGRMPPHLDSGPRGNGSDTPPNRTDRGSSLGTTDGSSS